MFKSLIAEDCEDPLYGWGYYYGLKILIRKKDGYVNAEKVCASFGMDYEDWIESFPHVPSKAAVGPFINPIFLPSLVIWCSKDYMVKLSEDLNKRALENRDLEKDLQEIEAQMRNWFNE